MLKYLPITAAMIVLIVAAVFLRLPELGVRPFHNDEAVNAAKAEALWRTSEYRYDPTEFHGPTLPYFTLPFISISGAGSYGEMDEGMFRGVVVLFGVLVVWLTIFTGRYIGWPAAVIAAALVAVSPAFIYWSRYYIHEMLLVLFTLGAIQAAWRYTEKPSLPLAALVGAFFGLMHATKETGALSGFAMLLALLAMNFMQRSRNDNSRGTTSPGSPDPGMLRSLLPVHFSHLLLGIAAFVIVAVVLFTSFFIHWRGPIDSIATYGNWIGMGTSGNEGRHLNPWHYYFSVLWWNPIGSVRMIPLFADGEGPSIMPSVFTEAIVLLLALVGMLAAAFRFGIADRLVPYVRFLALYTVILTLVYCIIPYKTPWSMLSFYHGFVMLAGVGAAAVGRVLWLTAPNQPGSAWARSCKRSVAVLLGVILLFAAIHLAWQSVLLNQRFYAHHLNPYAYSQPGLDVRRIAERAGQIAAVSDEGRELVIRVIHGGNYGPLPYYLRGFSRVGYHPAIPEQPDAAIIIADPNLADRIDELVQHEYHHEYYGLRRHAPVEVYIRRDLWDRFIAAQKSP